jgi:hypothetical protein
LRAVLRTDLEHCSHFLGYSDDAKRRRKVDAWMRKPDAIDWQAEIDQARRHGQELRLGQEGAEHGSAAPRRVLSPVAGSPGKS